MVAIFYQVWHLLLFHILKLIKLNLLLVQRLISSGTNKNGPALLIYLKVKLPNVSFSPLSLGK